MATKLEDLPARVEIVPLDGKETLRIDPKKKSILVKSDISNFIMGVLIAGVILVFVFGALLRSGRMTGTLAVVIGVPVLVVGGLLFMWLLGRGDTDRKAFYVQIVDHKVTYWWEGRKSDALKRSVKSFYVQSELKSREVAGSEGMKIDYKHGSIYHSTCFTTEDCKAAKAYLRSGGIMT